MGVGEPSSAKAVVREGSRYTVWRDSTVSENIHRYTDILRVRYPPRPAPATGLFLRASRNP